MDKPNGVFRWLAGLLAALVIGMAAWTVNQQVASIASNTEAIAVNTTQLAKLVALEEERTTRELESSERDKRIELMLNELIKRP